MGTYQVTFLYKAGISFWQPTLLFIKKQTNKKTATAACLKEDAYNFEVQSTLEYQSSDNMVISVHNLEYIVTVYIFYGSTSMFFSSTLQVLHGCN